jgi:predicted MFS family arabinose efflux permease
MQTPSSEEDLKPTLGCSPGYKWMLVSLLFFVAALNYADRTVFTTVLPLLREDLKMSDMALAAVGGFFLWSYALFSPIAGSIGDSFPRRSLIIGSLIAWSLVTASAAFVSNEQQLLVMRILLGATESLYIPAAIGLIAEHHSARTRAIALGIHYAGFNVGIVGGGTFAGYVGDFYGWRPAVFALGIAGLVLAILCKVLILGQLPQTAAPVKDPPPNQFSRGSWVRIREVLKIPSFIVLSLESMLVGAGIWILVNWLPLYMRESFGMSLGAAGFSGTSFITLGGVLGILLGGILSDRLARKNKTMRMRLQGICYLISVPFLASFLWLKHFELIATALFLFFFFRSLAQASANALICDVLTPDSRSTGVGLMNMLNCFAGGTGILIVGFLKNAYGLTGLFAGISIIVLVVAVALFTWSMTFLGRDLQQPELLSPST